MIVVLVGESASGKSTVAKILEQEQPNFSKVVTYTTRPMRDGEIDGVDYHFIDNNKFNELVEQNFFVEHANYRDWQYGTAINFNKDEDKVIVLTPAGARALRAYAEKHTEFQKYLMVIYLWVDRRSRMIKIIQRGDNIDEAYRRNLSDVGQFDSFKRETDYTIDNENYKKNAFEVYLELSNLIETMKKKNLNE